MPLPMSILAGFPRFSLSIHYWQFIVLVCGTGGQQKQAADVTLGFGNKLRESFLELSYKFKYEHAVMDYTIIISAF